MIQTLRDSPLSMLANGANVISQTPCHGRSIHKWQEQDGVIRECDCHPCTWRKDPAEATISILSGPGCFVLSLTTRSYLKRRRCDCDGGRFLLILTAASDLDATAMGEQTDIADLADLSLAVHYRPGRLREHSSLAPLLSLCYSQDLRLHTTAHHQSSTCPGHLATDSTPAP